MEKYIPVIFLDKIIQSSDDRCKTGRTGKDNQLLGHEALWHWVRSPATEGGDTGKCLVFDHWQSHLGIQVFWKEFPGISAIGFTWTKPSFSKRKQETECKHYFLINSFPEGLLQETGMRKWPLTSLLSSEEVFPFKTNLAAKPKIWTCLSLAWRLVLNLRNLEILAKSRNYM